MLLYCMFNSVFLSGLTSTFNSTTFFQACCLFENLYILWHSSYKSFHKFCDSVLYWLYITSTYIQNILQICFMPCLALALIYKWYWYSSWWMTVIVGRKVREKKSCIKVCIKVWSIECLFLFLITNAFFINAHQNTIF